MKHLAVNAMNLAPGGGLTGLLGYLGAWRDCGRIARITVIASREGVARAVRERFPDITLLVCASGQSPARRFLSVSLGLGRIISEIKPDVVMSTQSGIVNCSAPQLIHHRNLHRFRCSYGQRVLRLEIKELTKDYAARLSLRRAACNVFISEYMRREAERFVPESAPRNHVCYNGLAQKRINAAPLTPNQWSGQPHLVAVQDTQAHKDNPTLLNTLRLLTEMEPNTEWRLCIAGGGNWEEFAKNAAKMGLSQRIEYRGFLEEAELDSLLRRSMCLVFTSRCEAFGNPPLEAMSCRCPVIASDCTAIPEVVGDAGMLVRPGDVAAFANAVLQVKNMHELRQRLVDKGLERIKMFCWEDSAMRMLEMFESLGAVSKSR